ncbi:hypothetical protein [Actinopolymorpha sp. B9G3]|uniref:hypothetical protein n=1 Tax=Actinopolymorpha sp. B9G3 TaxID=3158970 RepID=UPI0032D9407B
MDLDALTRKAQIRAELDQVLLALKTMFVELAGGVVAFARDAETRLRVDPTCLSPVYETVKALAEVSEGLQQGRQMLRAFHGDAAGLRGLTSALGVQPRTVDLIHMPGLRGPALQEPS